MVRVHNESPSNLMAEILSERDRLIQLRNSVPKEQWESNEFSFYRLSCNVLINDAAKALSGLLDIVSMISLYKEMKGFEE